MEFKVTKEEDKFICPECKSEEAGFEEMLSMEEPISNKTNKDPWASVLQQVNCSTCQSVIPSHIAYRWEDMSIEEAKQQWNKLYKKNNHKRKFD